jgi:hypothetical protein
VSLIGWSRELPAYEIWEVLPGPRDVCYSSGMPKNSEIDTIKAATAETTKRFEKAVKDGEIANLKQAERWMKDFNAGVQSA